MVAWIGLLPISVTLPVNFLVGHRVDGDLGLLAELHERDVGLVDLDLRLDDRHVGDVSSTVPALFIVPMMTVSPCSMFRRVTMPSIGRLDRAPCVRSYCACSSDRLLLRGCARRCVVMSLLARCAVPSPDRRACVSAWSRASLRRQLLAPRGRADASGSRCASRGWPWPCRCQFRRLQLASGRRRPASPRRTCSARFAGRSAAGTGPASPGRLPRRPGW